MSGILFLADSLLPDGTEVTSFIDLDLSTSTPILNKDMSASQFDHLSAGWQTTCVIFNEQLQCFGWNQYGQVGVGSTSDQYFAADVIVPSVDSVAPGVVHTCAITTEKDLFCWGSNDSVNILINDESSDVPVLADVEGSVLKVASGRSHICAIVKKAEAMFLCWGDNEFGMLGTNSTTTAFEPVGVQWDDIPKSIAAGYYHSCAISSRDNTLWCWGLNFNGQAGLGSNVNVLVPTQVLDIGEVKTVSLGYYHTCAVASPNDSTYCFGFNSQGQLGLGNIEDQNRPQKVNLGFPAQTVATGRDHTCAILLSGVLKCWGSNEFGQLGVGVNTQKMTNPIVVPIGGIVKKIALGKVHTCATLHDQTLWCWGSNSHGQLGLGQGVANQYLPTKVSILPSALNPSTASPASSSPTMQPTPAPTVERSTKPSSMPTREETFPPTITYTMSPTTSKPTPIRFLSPDPTTIPTASPTLQPTTFRPEVALTPYPTAAANKFEITSSPTKIQNTSGASQTKKTIILSLFVTLCVCPIIF